MYKFPAWSAQIAEVSTRPEFQNLNVKIVDPILVEGGGYDYDKGGYAPVTDEGEVYTGPARLIAVRAGVNRENSETTNSDTITSIRVQLPSGAIGRLSRGCVLTVLDSPQNASLTQYVFTLTSALQGGHAASRTLEFMASGDAEAYDE